MNLNQKLRTSRLAKQYQQKTCLQRLHIIWAQPSSFSIGTTHIGQYFIRSLSNGSPKPAVSLSSPNRRNCRVFSSHDIAGCH